MTPSPNQLRLCAYLLEHPEVPWQWRPSANWNWSWDCPKSDTLLQLLMTGEIRINPDFKIKSDAKYSREGLTLLVLHLHDCDQYGVINAESPDHLWFSRHGGYYKLSKATGEVEALKEAEF